MIAPALLTFFRILSFRLEVRRPPDMNREAVILLLNISELHSFDILEQLLLFFEILNKVQFHWG